MRKIFAWILGITFIASGLLKAIDPYGGALKISEYLSEFSFTLLNGHEMTISIALCAAEMILGLFLIFGLLKRTTAIATLAMYAIFTPLTAYLALSPTAQVQDCGCFGDVLVMTNNQTFLKNLILIAIAIFYTYSVFRCSTKSSINKPHFLELLSGVYIVVLSLAIPIYSATFLPPFDFLDYNRGDKLNLTQVNSKLAIYDAELNDVSNHFTQPEKYHIFITLQDCSTFKTNEIESLHYLPASKNVTLSILTSSSPERCANEVFERFYTDAATLKSLVRSQSGVVAIKNDTIVGKWRLENEIITDLTSQNIESKIAKQSRITIVYITTLAIATVLILLLLTTRRKYAKNH